MKTKVKASDNKCMPFHQILEYIIGSAACACALSALVDILTDGAFSNITAAWAGPAPPDDSILRE